MSLPKPKFSDPQLTRLARAIQHDDLTEIDRLVASSVDINAMDPEGVTPLLWALLCKKERSFTKLLECGANPDQQLPHYLHSVSHLVAHSPELGPEWLEIVLAHGANPELANGPFGQTLIFSTVASRRKDKLDLLIKKKVNLNAHDSSGSPPMEVAAGFNWFDSVYYLLKAGSDPTIKDEQNGKGLIDEIMDSSVSREFPVLWEFRERVIDELYDRGMGPEFEKVGERLIKQERDRIDLKWWESEQKRQLARAKSKGADG